MRSRTLAIGAFALAGGVAVAGCGSSNSSTSASTATTSASSATAGGQQGTQTTQGTVENNSPTGDIPDSTVYVAYKPPTGGYEVKVPEGWSRTTSPAAATFTDKLNTIQLESRTAGGTPTASAGQAELKQLASTVPGFKPGKVSIVTRNAGKAVLITYTGGGPKNPVTGKSQQNAFERYLFFNKGKVLVVTLSGPTAADNVDPWRTVTDSVKWTA